MKTHSIRKPKVVGTALFASGAATAVRAACSGATRAFMARVHNLKFIGSLNQHRTFYRGCSARRTGGDGGGSATCKERRPYHRDALPRGLADLLVGFGRSTENLEIQNFPRTEAMDRGGDGPSGRAVNWCGDNLSPHQPNSDALPRVLLNYGRAVLPRRPIPHSVAAAVQTALRASVVNYLIWIVCAAALLTGCTVGPNFKKPAAPNETRYTPAPLPVQTATTPAVTAGEAQQFVAGMDIPGQWWTLFRSQPLNDLIQRALTNSPDLAAAQAALAQARENVLAQNGAYYPSLNASISVSRQKTSEQIAPVPNANQFNFSLFTPEVSVAYSPDVFGLNRRTVESLKAQENGARFALAAADVTLSANIVVAAIQQASLRAQIDATRRLIAINENILQVTRAQFAKGAVARAAVAQQETQLAQSIAALPPLMNQLSQNRDQLAALSGGFPSDALPETFDLAALQLPRDLPVSLPSQLVEQRPDIRQAEENLHSASALIGVSVAHRIPAITLTANAGTMALTAGEIFSGGAGFWDIGAGVTQPIFQGGTLLHQERAARDAYLQAAAQYRSTVITAFQNVADTLNALQHDADTLQSAAGAANAAKVSLDLTRRQLEIGSAGYLDVLNAQQTYQQTTIAVIQAQANRYSDTAALFQALGGGWWNSGDVETLNR